MFVEFEQDRSYIWLFLLILPVCVVLTFIGQLHSGALGVFLGLGLPMTWLTICEYRSDILLDGSWRATYVRGSFVYDLVIRLKILLVAFLVLFLIYKW